MVTREDNLKMIIRPNGSTLIEFEDGTRLTRFYDDSDSAAAAAVKKSLNSSEFKTTSSDFKTSRSQDTANDPRAMFTKVECPGFATTVFNSKSAECNLLLGNGTVVSCDPTRCAYNVQCPSGEQIDVAHDGFISFCAKYVFFIT
jgi:hypothetical protein